MSAQPPRRSSMRDADEAVAPPPPYGTAPGEAAHRPYAATGAHTTPAAEQTITDIRHAGHDPSLAMARVSDDLPAAESTAPPLTPDAIIPPGVVPEAPPEPDPEPEMDATRPTPSLGAGPFPGGPGMPPSGPSRWAGMATAGPHRALIIGGAGLAAILLAGGGVLTYTTLSGGEKPEHHRSAEATRSAVPPPPLSPAPPTPSPTPSKRPRPKPTPIDIRDEKKDPVPLSVTEVFPKNRIKIAGRTFLVMKTVLNNHCDLTANGAFSAELTRQHCRYVVRATFVSDDEELAVTTGIAAMPTDAAAAAAMKAQDPEHYEWFRGMKADKAAKIDQAGGYATSVRRGRYICFAYVAYADGHKPKKNDKKLKQAGTAFRDAAVDPIDTRVKRSRRAKH